MRDSHWISKAGDPHLTQIYGFASWTPEHNCSIADKNTILPDGTDIVDVEKTQTGLHDVNLVHPGVAGDNNFVEKSGRGLKVYVPANTNKLKNNADSWKKQNERMDVPENALKIPNALVTAKQKADSKSRSGTGVPNKQDRVLPLKNNNNNRGNGVASIKLASKQTGAPANVIRNVPPVMTAQQKPENRVLKSLEQLRLEKKAGVQKPNIAEKNVLPKKELKSLAEWKEIKTLQNKGKTEKWIVPTKNVTVKKELKSLEEIRNSKKGGGNLAAKNPINGNTSNKVVVNFTNPSLMKKALRSREDRNLKRDNDTVVNASKLPLPLLTGGKESNNNDLLIPGGRVLKEINGTIANNENEDALTYNNRLKGDVRANIVKTPIHTDTDTAYMQKRNPIFTAKKNDVRTKLTPKGIFTLRNPDDVSKTIDFIFSTEFQIPNWQLTKFDNITFGLTCSYISPTKFHGNHALSKICPNGLKGGCPVSLTETYEITLQPWQVVVLEVMGRTAGV